MAILETIESNPGRFFMECPGCKMPHHVLVGEGAGPRWTFNGNMEKPTFSPSILVTYTWGPEEVKHVCHSFIVDGVWQYLPDCTHRFAGQHIPLPEIGTVNEFVD